MICIHHNDADGIGAAFVVNHKHPECKFYPIDYGQPFPLDQISPGEKVFIVDYSIEPELMCELLRITSDVVWIDHHASAIKKYDGFKQNIPGIRKVGIAGCMLTYYYLHRKNEDEDIESVICDAPYFLKLIADFDVWTWKYGDDTAKFNIAFDLVASIKTLENLYSFPEKLEDYFNNGKAMLEYRKQWTAKYMKRFGYETEFEGMTCFCVNLGNITSDFYNLLEKEYPLYIAYCYDPAGFYRVSLRGKGKVNCFEIALKYGGGGHHDSSGFVCEDINFLQRKR